MTNPEAGPPFDLRDTSALKAIGILAIVLHNFFHQVPGAVRENEFGFNLEHFERFLAIVVDPTQTFQAIFSYLGHFGVQLFIFLSAYGLAIKYWTVPSWGRFLWSRVGKIYPMYFLALGLWMALVLVQHGPSNLVKVWDELVLTSLAVINLVPGYGLPPIGPWWFLAFIVQFYALWPALAAFSRRFGGRGLLVLSLASLAATMALHPVLIRWEINLFETPIGHLPELCLGIACARYGLRIGPVSALAAAGVFVLGNLYALAWPLTFLSVLVVLLYVYQVTARVWRERKLLDRIAEVSMPMFFVNGFLRGPFLAVAARIDRWYGDILLGLCFAGFAWGVAWVLSRIEQRIVPLFQRRHGAGAALGAVAALGLAGCGDDLKGPATLPGVVITVAPADLILTVGATAALAAAVRDGQGDPVEANAIRWASSAPDIVAVSPTGFVTALAIGVATVGAYAQQGVGFARVVVQMDFRLPVLLGPATLRAEMGTPTPLCPEGEGGRRADGGRECSHSVASRYSLDFSATSSAVEPPRVFAAAEGIVNDVCLQPPPETTCGPHGPFVYIEHGAGFASFHSHLDPASVVVRRKRRIAQGGDIGRMGSWGGEVPWVHFEVRYNNQAPLDNPILDGLQVDGKALTEYRVGR